MSSGNDALPIGLSHMGICVRNLERSLHFYRDLVGLNVVKDEMLPVDLVPRHVYAEKQEGLRRIIYLQAGTAAGSPVLVLGENAGSSRSQPMLDENGIHHVAFSVPDLAAFVARMSARGATIFGPPESYQDDRGAFRTVFYKDPDGILVQFDEEIYRSPQRQSN